MANFCLALAVILTILSTACKAEETEVSRHVENIKTWVQDKLTELGRSYGYDGGYDTGHYHDDNDDGLFGGGLIGGLLMVGLVLAGLALLATLFAPLLMLFTTGLFGTTGVTPGVTTGVIPTVIPTITGRRRRRNANSNAGIGAASSLIKLSPGTLATIIEALRAYDVEERCGELFMCSIHKNRLVNKLGAYKQVFTDILRYDLSEMEETGVMPKLQRAARIGMRLLPCRKPSSTCASADNALKKLMTDQ